jgi:uncharacterized protein with HEPN domain
LPSKHETQRLADIIENIDLAAAFIGDRGLETFLDDALRLAAVERCLQRITEACIKIGPDRMGLIAPDQPFARIRGFGNMLRHGYDNLDPSIIWLTVREDLPSLREACVRALAAAQSS